MGGLAMARWTVVDGDQQLVIESAGTGLIAVDIARPPFVTDPEHLKELRAKLSLAIGSAQAELSESAGPSQQDDDGEARGSHGGEDRD
jgi:hypothetical protein